MFTPVNHAMYTTKNSWTATHNKNTQTSTTLKCKAFAAKFYTGRVLHQKMLTPQNLLGQRVFSPKCLDQTTFTAEDVTSKRLHQKTFDIRGTLEQRHFIPKSFYARKFLQNLFTLGDFCNKICLRSAPITPNKHCASKSFYTKRLWHHQLLY